VLLLEDEEPLQTSDVPRTPHSAPAPLKGAFVFLNACQAGLPGSSPWGHEGWVNTFFEAGAVAMVAPSWMISDAAAGRFSQTLYHRLAAGETLGRAAWWAREEIREQGSADHLGYAVYAYPEARWCPPPSPDGTERP
jgi:CHAT domain-containing protein